MEGIAPEKRKELARVRSLMVGPHLPQWSGIVDIWHSDDSRVWLTDGYSLVDVTGSLAVEGLDDDGQYRLITTKGLVSRGMLMRNIGANLARVRKFHMYPAYPTPLSITDNEAKAMLMFVEILELGSEGVQTRYPLAMNEDVWHAVKAQYPDARLWHAGYGGPFKISTASQPELAYVEPIEIPPDLCEVAQAVADLSKPDTRELPPQRVSGSHTAV